LRKSLTSSSTRAVWKNPHPERTIATLDLISAMRAEAPFVVAITLE
jgi:hypothetical protein